MFKVKTLLDQLLSSFLMGEFQKYSKLQDIKGQSSIDKKHEKVTLFEVF